jgi:HSP20 family molecular chaperone IbpA
MSSRDLENWMWAEACDMLDRAERMHRQFFQPARKGTPRPTWEPPVDVLETDQEFGVQVALPGVEPERIEALVDGNELIVRGQRRLPIETNSTVVHRLEIPHGHFERRVQLPPGRFELGRRDLVNGCLVLTFRKL